ncbi:MAG: hypothetical protein J5X21_09470 [Candidatus Accumulibacter sp.]|nr:hypothetical protein [Candidatus Accumulibacter conexus]
MKRASLLVAGCCVLLGCAGLDPHADDPAAQRRLRDDAVGDCARLFAAVDRRIDADGTRDAQSPRVPGFPHLRTDRVLARLAAATTVESGDEPAAPWYRALAELDAADRSLELANTAGTTTATVAALAACRQTLSVADQELLAKLRAVAQVPDDYSTTLRALGLYPLTRYLFAAGVERWQQETLAIFAAQAQGATGGRQRVRYVPEPLPESLPTVRDLPQLGLPGVAGPTLAELVVRHAPRLEIETAGDQDRPGALVWQADGVGGERLAVATAAPVLYVRSGHAQMAGRWLLQLSYTAWFSERPPERAVDLLAGRFDGLLWRVTLAEDGSPLVYDTIHPCGCYHLFFPGERLRARARPAGIDEGLFAPQVLPAPMANERVVLRLAAGTHYLQQVVVEAAAAAAGVPLALRDDDELRSLPLPGGGRRSVFAADGLLPGSERLERFFFWPMGVRSAGQMRQWGRHATAFVGRRHFDDPALLDRYFERLP